jgi:site-specific recombinase XerD
MPALLMRRAPKPWATISGGSVPCFSLMEDGTLDASPLRTLKAPPHKQDQIEPFSEAQVQALLKACAQTRQSKRDEAMILLLLDTGCRSGELCGLSMRDFNISERTFRVLGKGNAFRSIPVSAKTCKAVIEYVRFQGRKDDDPIFVSYSGRSMGERLKPNAITHWAHRLGKLAGIDGEVRCSPHTFRHTFAIWFLRNGGDIVTLQMMMGHTEINVTRRYLAWASSDTRKSHVQYSPVNNFKRGK